MDNRPWTDNANVKSDMALWQITFHVTPKRALDLIDNPSKLTSTDENFGELFNDELIWQEEHHSIDCFDALDTILPKTKSWSKDTLQWGNLESNVFEVGQKDNIVTSASFRIDFTSAYEDVLRRIVDICLLNGFILIEAANLSLVPLNYASVNGIIINSPQVVTYNRLAGE